MAIDNLTALVTSYVVAGIAPQSEPPVATVARVIVNASDVAVLDTDANGALRAPLGFPVGLNGAVFKDGLGTGAIFPLELVLQISRANCNVLALQNLSTSGWAANSFRDLLAERGAAGAGGSASTAAAGYRGNVYLEASNIPLDGSAAGDSGHIILSQFTTYGAVAALGWHHRLVCTDDGYVIIYPCDDGGGTGHAKTTATFDRLLPVLTLGNSTGANGYGELRGADANWSIVLREGGNSAVANSLYSFGGSYANGGGWRVLTGGVKASQTVGLHVADDLVAVNRGFLFTTQALSGAGAVNLTTGTTKVTTTGAAQALTLANGTDGQIKTILHDVDGGSAVLTPTTKSGFSTITFTNAGETATLQYATTRGWHILALFGAVAA